METKPRIRFTRRKAYQMVRHEGMRIIPIGTKKRLLSKRRAERIFRFLISRGHDIHIRYFGIIHTPKSLHLFD